MLMPCARILPKRGHAEQLSAALTALSNRPGRRTSRSQIEAKSMAYITAVLDKSSVKFNNEFSRCLESIDLDEEYLRVTHENLRLENTGIHSIARDCNIIIISEVLALPDCMPCKKLSIRAPCNTNSINDSLL